jgi:hypothetical protein
MSSKKFLIPVGAAVAALTPVGVQAVSIPQQNADVALGHRTSPASGLQTSDPVFQTIQYLIGPEAHLLLLRQPASGILYAQHGSHSSHGSHGSHRSHRSGY